jgi:LysM repeat protein
MRTLSLLPALVLTGVAAALAGCVPEEPPRVSMEPFPWERTTEEADPDSAPMIAREVEPEVPLSERWRSPFAVSSSGRTAPRQGRTVVVLRADSAIVTSIGSTSEASPPRPLAELSAASDPRAVPEAPAPARTAEPRTHEVGPGDTLSGLAQRYNVSTQQLRDLNRLADDRIRLGQELLIPPARSDR